MLDIVVGRLLMLAYFSPLLVFTTRSNRQPQSSDAAVGVVTHGHP